MELIIQCAKHPHIQLEAEFHKPWKNYPRADETAINIGECSECQKEFEEQKQEAVEKALEEAQAREERAQADAEERIKEFEQKIAALQKHS